MDFPVVKLKGTFYGVGKQLGDHFRDLIRETLQSQNSQQNILLPFYHSDEGHLIVNRFLETSKSTFPQYIREIEGIADGAGVPFMELFLYHLETEILIYKGLPIAIVTEEGCSDVMLNNDNTVCFMHSEDAGPTLADKLYVVEEEIISEIGEPLEKFKALCYPGCLPGTAVSINSHGLGCSLNVLFQNRVFLGGIPRRIGARAAMAASSVDDAFVRLSVKQGLALGFNYQFGWVEDGQGHISTVEFAGSPTGTKYNIEDVSGFQYHLNNYVRLLDEGEYLSDPSSVHRHSRIQDLIQKHGEPSSHQDLIRIMNDRENVKFPVYRNGEPPDYLATGCIAVFDLKKREIHLYRSEVSAEEPTLSWNWGLTNLGFNVVTPLIDSLYGTISATDSNVYKCSISVF